MKVLLLLCYDGSRYFGFQRQKQVITVQGVVESVLSQIYSISIQVVASGRTDRGVHAEGQVITFEDSLQLTKKITLKKLPEVINRKLATHKEAIKVLSARIVAEDFHPRFDAKVRWYRYHLYLDSLQSNMFLDAFSNKVSNEVIREKLEIYDSSDVLRLEKYFSIYLGSHDFSSFCSAQEVSLNKTRQMYRIVVGRQGKKVWIDLFANAFLRGMVRSLVGNTLDHYLHEQKIKNKKVKKLTLKKSGKNEDYFIDSLKKILSAKDPNLAKKRAPAHGLVLKKVFYQPIFGNFDEKKFKVR